MWPFKKKQEMVELPPVVLSEEEREECEEFMRSIFHSDEGSCYARPDLADSTRRCFISMCLFGRAQRFRILAGGNSTYTEKACEAAAKGCAIFPISVSFYEFGSILDSLGKKDEAKTMFQEFLRRQGSEHLNDAEKVALKRLDMAEALARAEAAVRT